MQIKTIEEHVWFYYKQGFSIIPLGKNETNNLKRPSLSDWKQYQNRKATKDKTMAKKWIISIYRYYWRKG